MHAEVVHTTQVRHHIHLALSKVFPGAAPIPISCHVSYLSSAFCLFSLILCCLDLCPFSGLVYDLLFAVLLCN